MKKLLYVWFAALLFACGTEETNVPAETSTEADELKAENIRLKNESARKDSMINEYALYINEIQENLSLITGEQNFLAGQRGSGEFGAMGDEAELIGHIRSISELMAKSEARIAELKRKLQASGMEITEFEKIVINLSEQVQTKNMEVFQLQQELENVDAAYTELFVALEEKQDIIDQQADELNMAWYTIGSSKELRDNGVITKEGGLLGIGRTNKLKANLNHDYFTEINILESKEILLGGEVQEILTSHPEAAYEIVGSEGQSKLVIKDPERFWGVSKYLVVILD